LSFSADLKFVSVVGISATAQPKDKRLGVILGDVWSGDLVRRTSTSIKENPE
jgi:hypothetical protein